MLGDRLAGGAAAFEGRNYRLRGRRLGPGPVIGDVGLNVLELHLQLLDRPGMAFGAWPYCSRRTLAICGRRCRIMRSEAEKPARVCVSSSSAADARPSAAAGAARRTAISDAVSDMP